MHPGDLSEPLLGMSKETFAKLSNEVDVIVHSGANRSYWDYYQLLRGVNVSSTKELVQMATVRNIPVHFISSGGVLSLAGDDAEATDNISVSAYKPPVDGSMGYLASKWASEAYLENAAKHLGMPVYIHRVTPPENNTGVPDAEMIEDFKQVALKMKALPAGQGWNGSVDLIAVKPLAQRITESVLSEDSTEATSAPEFVQYASDVQVRMRDVMQGLEGVKLGEDFARMAPHKWVGKAKDMGIGYHFASQEFQLGGGELVLRR